MTILSLRILFLIWEIFIELRSIKNNFILFILDLECETVVVTMLENDCAVKSANKLKWPLKSLFFSFYQKHDSYFYIITFPPLIKILK